MLVALAQGSGVIKDIVIQGNDRVSREAILAQMRTKVGQPYVQASLDQDKQALEDTGFFQAVDVHADAVGNDWNVVVNVSEWPVIKEIRVTGNEAIKTEDILRVVTLKPGDVYNLKERNVIRTNIQNLYKKKGYVGDVEDFGPLAESPNTLNIKIIEWKVGKVKVEGNDRTKDRVIARLVKTRPGEPFNLTKWQNDLRRLYGTQWFESVESRQEPEELGRINLTAMVKETRTGTFNVGLQVDPRSSFAGFFRIQDPNFRGTGQNVGVNVMQSTQGGGTSIDLDYGNPFMDRYDTSMNASLYSRIVYRFTGSGFGTNGTPTSGSRYFETRRGGAVQFTRPKGDDVSYSLGARAETVTTSHIDTTNANDFIKQDGNIATVTAGYTKNNRDADIEPSRGSWSHAEVQPGFANITEAGGAVGNTLLGKANFVKSYAEYRHYFSSQPPRVQLTDPRRVLAFRVRYGDISGRTPFFEQFFAGGSDTLRGYEEDRFWGNKLLLSTLEYRLPIQKAMNVIGFVDYGGAWGGYGTVGTFSQSSAMKLHMGYGLGVSFRTPLGPIRLDFGFNENGKSRTHFLIGTSF
ncbi:MAG: outer membrane protein insertion porin family [Fimbriimonadaceae bacterium]|jgi:outer membrane protein insertion porin family|nr:outer membrane protein insertion porin family [Fimbriimonadaceae bacterium]